MDFKAFCFILILDLISQTHGEKLFLILVDGFRWDYFDLPDVELSGFSRIIREGVKAEYMLPDFPTNSFPNYRTIETGLHVESHGFVGNYMYDERTGDKFEFVVDENTNTRWFDGSEAFYVTAEKQGIKTALYYVPTTSKTLTHPSYCIPYTGQPTRADVQWAMKDGLERIHNGSADIVYLYYESVDRTGHFYGTDSEELKGAIQEIDDLLDELMDDIETLSLEASLDLIVISDHGMTDLNPGTLDISGAFNMDDVNEITEAGSLVYIWPKEGKSQQLYDSLKNFSPYIRVYYKEDIFDRWYLKKHWLISPLIVAAEPGWYMDHPKSYNMYSGYYQQKFVGNHGFDNTNADMRSIFLAKGPSFKSGYISKPFSNVNVYQLVCHVTSMKPRPHNGTWDDVKDMLTENTSEFKAHEQHTDL